MEWVKPELGKLKIFLMKKDKQKQEEFLVNLIKWANKELQRIQDTR